MDFNDLERLIADLNVSVRALRTTGEQYAKAYTEYREELSKELLKVREEGIPASMCSDIARGRPHIAKAKFNEICKEAIYKANQESINAIKLEIKILNEQIAREMGEY